MSNPLAAFEFEEKFANPSYWSPFQDARDIAQDALNKTIPTRKKEKAIDAFAGLRIEKGMALE